MRGDPDSSEELGWLGHFAKKSTRLKWLSMSGSKSDIFDNCSEQSVNKFFEDLGKCHHIERMDFSFTNLSEIIHKLEPTTKNNSITHWEMLDCYLGVGVSETNFLFNAFREMKSLKELSISYEYGTVPELAIFDDIVMAGCIPSLASCTDMQEMKLQWLGLSTHSCAALTAIFPRMASLNKLNLCGNLIGDDCVEVLVRGLAECTHLQELRLDRNLIGDNGLDMLIQGLPASVVDLVLDKNEIALARGLPLLRFEKLSLTGNPLSPGGP